MRDELRYEDAAEFRTGLEGWCCVKCRRYWGGDEHMARYCCATSMPCACGARITPRSYTCCDACRRKKADARWAERIKKAVAWDGETPLYSERDVRYFFSADEIADYMENDDEGGEPDKVLEYVEGLRLILCRPQNGRFFSMLDFLSDDLPADGDHNLCEADVEAIDKAVNDWIAKHAPYSWEPTNTPVTAESVIEFGAADAAGHTGKDVD